jgi:restriction system protein
MNFTTYFSRFINRINLIGKWVHLYRIRKAKKVLKTLQHIAKTPNSYGKIMVYLRKINPFVFEELILTVIENSNVRVIRNKRYTGDGGIDGIFKLKDKGKIIIQCKRYKSYINQSDVVELVEKTTTGKYHCGIFVHTGKTGTKAKNVALENKNILFISGNLLIDLILGKIRIEHYLHYREINDRKHSKGVRAIH